VLIRRIYLIGVTSLYETSTKNIAITAKNVTLNPFEGGQNPKIMARPNFVSSLYGAGSLWLRFDGPF
jgi:hypothetical protein